jgi:DNA mismatch repair protein MSH3
MKWALVMAPKLQEELREREASNLPRLIMDKPAGDVPCESSREAGLVCTQPYQGLMEACRRVLCDMSSAQSSNCMTDVLSCLKNVKEVALKIING